MIELVRIVENQSSLSSYRATGNEEHALQLELLIESTKPNNLYPEWHTLISTPFRYAPPHPEARFRAPYGKNVFYGSCEEETALYEQSYHFFKQRNHLPMRTETGIRTIFFVEAENSHVTNIKHLPNFLDMVHKENYLASQQFMQTNPDITFIIYPSCRDPKQRDNAAILDITHLSKNIKWESTRKFFYDNTLKQISWLDYSLHIQYSEFFS